MDVNVPVAIVSHIAIHLIIPMVFKPQSELSERIVVNIMDIKDLFPP